MSLVFHPELGPHGMCVGNGVGKPGPCPRGIAASNNVSKKSNATGTSTSAPWISAGVGAVAGGLIGHFMIKKGIGFTIGGVIILGSFGYYIGTKI